MELIIGGYRNGKLQWFLENTKLDNLHIIDGAECDFGEIYSCQVINHFETFVKRYSKVIGEDFTENICKNNPEIIIITDEIGSGIVPLAAADREYRELHGRICCELAKFSCSVTRVISGIGIRIK